MNDLIYAHSDDLGAFCDKQYLSECDALVENFKKDIFKATDCPDKEFVGVKIIRDEEWNYFIDQHRIIDDTFKSVELNHY